MTEFPRTPRAARGSRIEQPETKNTRVVETSLIYDPLLQRQPRAINALLLSEARKAVQEGKKFLQVVFANGTRVMRIYPTGRRTQAGEATFSLKVPKDAADDFRKEPET